MRRTTASAVALIALALTVSGAAAARAQTSISLGDYVDRLNASAETLRSVPTGSDPRAAIDAAISSIELPAAVLLPDGTSVVVTEGSLLGGIPRGDPGAASMVADRLQLAADAADAADAAGSKGSPDAASIRAALTKAYAGLRPEPPSLVSRILNDIFQAIGWAFDHLAAALAGSGIGSLFTLAFLILVGFAVFLVAKRVRSNLVTEARVVPDKQDVLLVDWRREADEALSAGDLAGAVRALYHVLLATLSALGVVRDAPSLTAGECRRAVRVARPGAAAVVDRATDVFESVTYGKVPADMGDVKTLRDAERAVKRG